MTASWQVVRGLILRDAGEIGEAALARLREELPSYGAVPPEELRSGVFGNVERALRDAGGRSLPTESELEGAGRVGEVRARQGIPVEDVLRGFRIAAGEVWSRARDRARERGVSDAELLEVLQSLSDWVDAVMARAASAHRRVELELARRDQHRRANLLRSVLFGSFDKARLREEAAAFGLRMDLPYLAFRARPEGDTTLEALERAVVADTIGEGHASLVGLVEGDLAGLITARPRRNVNGTVGLGPPADLSSVGESFRLASTVLRTAIAFGMGGVFELENLGLRVPVSTQNRLGELLVARYLKPLEPLGAFGRTIEESLEEFFRYDMKIEATAAALFVHPNRTRTHVECHATFYSAVPLTFLGA